MSKVTKKERIKELERQVRGLTVLFSSLNTWSEYADSMLTELNHALPDPEYDAKCDAQEADVDASLDRHRERLGLNKPQLKTLDQSVFDGLDEKWVFAAVDKDGRACAFDRRPQIYDGDHFTAFMGCFELGYNYDTTNWENSLIERDKVELTGKELVRAMLDNGMDKVLVRVATFSSTDFEDRLITFARKQGDEVVTNNGNTWDCMDAINNQGEPLTQSEVGL